MPSAVAARADGASGPIRKVRSAPSAKGDGIRPNPAPRRKRAVRVAWKRAAAPAGGRCGALRFRPPSCATGRARGRSLRRRLFRVCSRPVRHLERRQIAYVDVGESPGRTLKHVDRPMRRSPSRIHIALIIAIALPTRVLASESPTMRAAAAGVSPGFCPGIRRSSTPRERTSPGCAGGRARTSRVRFDFRVS